LETGKGRDYDYEHDLVMAEMPYFTLFNDRQEGWSIFDNSTRLRDVFSQKWDLVYGFSHKLDCVLPGLMAKARGAKFVLDWADWWGTSEGIFQKCVLPSNDFQSMPGPLRLGRRMCFAAEAMWEPWAYGAADAVTLISDEFLKHPRAPRDLAAKSLVMHSGAPLEAIRPMEKAAARQRIGVRVPEGSVVLGYVANYHMAERLLLEAFARVCRAMPNVHLVVVGADLECVTPEIHEATRERLHHFGRVPFERVGDFLGASDMLLLPLCDVALDRARYPHKLSDYVASGRPVVACDVGASGRLLREYGIGRLSAPDAESFSRVTSGLSAAPREWEEIGAETRAAAEEHFDWDRICDRLFAWWSDRLGVSAV
jgi:glycosyltransferase involved in cell wall biosynthesis